jgi:hypothetical protein
LQKVLERGGFEKEKIRLEKVDVYCTTLELTHFATMPWNFLVGRVRLGGWVLMGRIGIGLLM